ncbi:MAG: outer membrane beta-barrel protein [bacterium]
MKNLNLFRTIIVVAVFGLISVLSTYRARADIGLGIFAGLATPNSEINNIYNSDKLTDGATVNNLVRDAAKTGFDVGVKFRLPLGNSLLFNAGISWCSFPKTNILIQSATSNSALATLVTTQNIFPISVGMHLLSFKPLGIYATGELTYNIMNSSVEVTAGNYSNIDTRTTYNRTGFGLGAGIDLDLFLTLINIEAKYNFANVLGKVNDEKAKNYLTVNVAVYFGGKQPK